ncbi:MAG: Glutaredoxin-3 [Alphaproteobacteria bacterium MarineAlpha2_Bin1]|nr:MAG: Glutaredoxin-3 [Alphaproteobacteria bacterium MarineAlpha2_Bin1]|tara:strand:+ start:262 stop:531 length:270 start_codon:yes stop_codon:yes gene_type:complete
MAKVEIYTTFLCGYCSNAKNLLNKKGIDYIEIDVSYNFEERKKMEDRAAGKNTVPQIFINGNSIGGFDELVELDKLSLLEDLNTNFLEK